MVTTNSPLVLQLLTWPLVQLHPLLLLHVGQEKSSSFREGY